MTRPDRVDGTYPMAMPLLCTLLDIGVDLAGILGDAWREPQVDWCELGRVWGGVSPLQLTRGSGGVS